MMKLIATDFAVTLNGNSLLSVSVSIQLRRIELLPTSSSDACSGSTIRQCLHQLHHLLFWARRSAVSPDTFPPAGERDLLSIIVLLWSFRFILVRVLLGACLPVSVRGPGISIYPARLQVVPVLSLC